MKILVIPDIHQTEHYKKPLKELYDSVDKVIFLGDYFDFHDPEGVVDTSKAIENFNDICKLAKDNPDKVDALIGNHDDEYITDDMTNTYQYHNETLIGKAILSNLDVLKVAVMYDDWLFSHAGVSDVFLYLNGLATNNNGKFIPIEGYVEELNKKLHRDGADFLVYSRFDISHYGDDKTQTPTWIRPNSLLSNCAHNKQVVGHTAVGSGRKKPAFFEYRGNKVIFLDTDTKDQYFVFDTEKEPDFQDVEKKGKEIVHIVNIKVQKLSENSYMYKIVIDAEDEPCLYHSCLSAAGLDSIEVAEYIDAALEELAEIYDLRGEIPSYKIE